jgi:hypothetical protein
VTAGCCLDTSTLLGWCNIPTACPFGECGQTKENVGDKLRRYNGSRFYWR